MRVHSLFSCAFAVSVVFAACGDNADRPALTKSPSGIDGGGSSSSKDSGGPNNVDPNTFDRDSGVVGANPLPENCAADTQKATQLPLDLYIMVDSSGSMDEKTAGGTTKWADVKTALTAFVDDPNSAGMGVGLEFFPAINNAIPDSCDDDGACGAAGPCWYRRGCTNVTGPQIQFCATDSDCGGTSGACQDLGQCVGLLGGACFSNNDCFVLSTCVKPLAGYCKGRDSCTVADYASPSAAIAALPASAPGLKNLLGARTTGGLTPTAPALAGAIEGAKAQIGANPTHTVAVVLATDGFPTECTPQDIPSIASSAQSGVNAGVKTFVIGVFTQDEETEAKTNLNQIAASGGSGQAFVINTGQNVSQAFLQALNTIRGAALPCDYTLPVPESGTPDYSKVNVQYTDGNGQKTTIFYVANSGACDPTSGGWYYDKDPSTGAPSKVIVCPKTCEGFKADGKAQVDIVQGCETVKVVK
jgi:hypothetical protein